MNNNHMHKSNAVKIARKQCERLVNIVTGSMTGKTEVRTFYEQLFDTVYMHDQSLELGTTGTIKLAGFRYYSLIDGTRVLNLMIKEQCLHSHHSEEKKR